MQVSRGVFDVGTVVGKLSPRFRHPPKISRPEWPVISAIRPLFYLIRFFGLAPFQISEDHFIPGCYSVIYSLCCIIVYIWTVHLVLVDALVRRESTMLETIQTGKVIFNCCVAILNVLMAIWTGREFIEVLNIVKRFDSRLADFGYPRKEKGAKIWIWTMCIGSTILWITVNRTGMAAFGEYWVYNVAYIVNYLVNSLSTIQFSSVVLLLGQRFRFLNNLAQQSKESTMAKKRYIAIDFKVIQQLHNSLMSAGESLSSQYAWPLLLWLMNLCVHSVSNLYFLIDWLMMTPKWAETKWPLVHCQTWWLFTFCSQLLLLHIACHFTSTEANSMGSIVFNWRTFSVGRNYGLEPSLHLINRRLNFSAAGCFHVNLPLLSSITAILTTYLALLMQFQG